MNPRTSNCYLRENRRNAGDASSILSPFPNYQNVNPGTPNFSQRFIHPPQNNASTTSMSDIPRMKNKMVPMKFNTEMHEPYKSVSDGNFKFGHSFNPGNKDQVIFNQGPSQSTNVRTCSPGMNMPGIFSTPMPPPTPKACENFLPLPQPHFVPQTPENANGYVCRSPIVGDPPVPFRNSPVFSNSNNNFQSYSTVPSSATYNQISNRPTLNNASPTIKDVNSDSPLNCLVPASIGQFNSPPPVLPPSSSYFPQDCGNNISSLLGNYMQQPVNNPPFNVQPCIFPMQSLDQPFSAMSHVAPDLNPSILCTNVKAISIKEKVLNTFLQKFNSKSKDKIKSDITIPEFRACLKMGLSLFKALQNSRLNLSNLVQSSQEEWDKEMSYVLELQNKLSKACAVLSIPSNLSTIQRKLNLAKKKKMHKKKSKEIAMCHRVQKEQEREKLHQEIDKWLDSLKEKNQKLKREADMQKEADEILSDVRRKIHDAKKTLDKINHFEKLRAARQANAMQKGLYIMPEHTIKFERKMSELRQCMLNQLSNYEMEEKALRVMLETEQEGQLEEEALWRLKKMKTFHQKKQNHIMKCLFGESEEPTPDDPLFLFYQYHISGNKSIDNLAQIRHHWDVHLSEMGEPIPQQWVVPAAPNSTSWEEFCSS